MVEPFEYPVVTQSAEPPVNRAPQRKVARQKRPGTPCPKQMENGLDDLLHRPTRAVRFQIMASKVGGAPLGIISKLDRPPLPQRSDTDSEAINDLSCPLYRL